MTIKLAFMKYIVTLAAFVAVACAPTWESERQRHRNPKERRALAEQAYQACVPPGVRYEIFADSSGVILPPVSADTLKLIYACLAQYGIKPL